MNARFPSRPRFQRDRRCLIGVSLLLALAPASSRSASGTPPPQRFGLSAEDEALRHKFRGIPKGGELYVDATYDTRMLQVVYQPNGKAFGPALGIYAPWKSGSMAYFGDEKYGLPLPKSLRYQRFSEDAPRNDGPDRFNRPFLGEPFLDVTVLVASRIPDAVLDRIRKYKGSLKLKLRLTPETILVGWEVRNGRSYPFKRDQWGNAYVTDEDVMIGGDFCEAQAVDRFVDGKIRLIRKKGWQIDPATGQRVETDF